MIWTASARCLQAADCRLRLCENACEREDGELYVAGLHGQSDDDVRRRGVTMASARKTIRQVPTKEAPRSVDGTPAVRPAQTREADLDRRWPAVSAVAPAEGEQHLDSPSAIRTQPGPLLVRNLLNDL